MAEVATGGYTGVIFLFHRVTKHVIVEWAGADADNKFKSNTEHTLLSLFQGSKYYRLVVDVLVLLLLLIIVNGVGHL